MGTFHDTQDPLHGVTVAAVIGDTVTVGRCHERTAGSVVLVDADRHTEGEDGKTNAEYLSRAARFGVWSKHDRLELDAAAVTSLAPLKDYFSATGEAVVPTESAPPPPPAAAQDEPPAEASAPVDLTPAAADEVARLLAVEDRSELGLRLGVAGGGCSGLVYQLEFTEQRDGDMVIPHEGFSIFLDRKSVIYLRGVTLDFEKGLGGKGFRFQNPNAANTCGCGESFAV